MDIPRHRLLQQHIQEPTHRKPEDLVRWMGAVQAQDPAAALWAVGLRTLGCPPGDVEAALDEGRILRTHVLRPTWHLVVPEDIGWMLALTAPRVHAANGPYYRKQDLDEATRKRTREALAKALQGGKHLVKEEVAAVLQRAGVDAEQGMRFALVMMDAELEGVVCSGPRQGKKATYALLEERAPRAKALPVEEALERLATRYFASRGPATVEDFAWWSGLSAKDAKRAVTLAGRALTTVELDGVPHMFAAEQTPGGAQGPRAHLLPNYDEYAVAYKNRDAIMSSQFVPKGPPKPGDPPLTNVVVLDGQVVGTWRRELAKKQVSVCLNLFTPPKKAQLAAVEEAAERYAAWLGLPLSLEMVG